MNESATCQNRPIIHKQKWPCAAVWVANTAALGNTRAPDSSLCALTQLLFQLGSQLMGSDLSDVTRPWTITVAPSGAKSVALPWLQSQAISQKHSEITSKRGKKARHLQLELASGPCKHKQSLKIYAYNASNGRLRVNLRRRRSSRGYALAGRARRSDCRGGRRCRHSRSCCRRRRWLGWRGRSLWRRGPGSRGRGRLRRRIAARRAAAAAT